MFFLFIQISILLLIATLFGWILGWFMGRRRTTDVTESYQHYRTVDERLGAFDQRLELLGKGNEVDLSGVFSRLDGLDSSVGRLANTDIDPVMARLQALEKQVACIRPTDVEGLHSYLRTIEGKIDAIEIPGQVDMSGITSGIAALSSTVAAVRQPNLEPLEVRLAELDTKVSQLRNVEVDLEPMHAHLRHLEGLLAQPAAPPQKDDLTKIEGIGPKIKELMYDDGIYSFADLASAPVERLQGILDRAGKRYQVHNPGTWPDQSAMARDDRWDDLKKWQEELNHGQ